MLARIHFIVRTDPTTRPARSTPTCSPRSWPTPPGSGTTTSGWCWSASSATSRPSTCSPGTRDALPGGLQGRAHAVRGGEGPGQAGAAGGARPAGDAPVPRRRGGHRRGRPTRTTAMDVRFKVYRYGEPMMLSAVLPVLHSLGVRVTDERPYEVDRLDGRRLPLRLRAAAARRAPGAGRGARRTWRTPSPRPGAARPRSTASTSWCCGPG